MGLIAVSDNKVLSMYRRTLQLPFGKRLFSFFGARQAPYFSSVSPIVERLEANHCQVMVRKRKAVQNHIGTVHVIAIANGLEMAMGFMAEASIPPELRWIPKGMTLEYPAKADADILCSARVEADAWRPGDLDVAVSAQTTGGTVVVRGVIRLWISERPDLASVL